MIKLLFLILFHNLKMFRYICLALFVLSVMSMQSRQAHQAFQSHNPGIISSECCAARGGTECGLVKVDCCIGKVQCKEEGWFIKSKYCPDDKQIWKTCPNSCIDKCKSSGGMVCSKNTDATFVCCSNQAGACTKNTFSSNVCAPDKVIKVTNCTAPSYTELFAGDD